MRARIAEIEVERIEESLWGGFWDIQRSASSSSPMSRYSEYASTLSSWSWPQAVVLVLIKTDAGESGLGWAEDGVAAASNIIQRHPQRDFCSEPIRLKSNASGIRCFVLPFYLMVAKELRFKP